MSKRGLDPIGASRRIEQRYTRYLRSTLRPQDAQLAEEFAELLHEPLNRLGRGPILQASPPYTKGASLADLISAGVVSPAFADVDQSVLPLDRPLYRHQEEAIVKIVAGDNALVATGTGSGKTESFLLPIINSLLAERQDGTLHVPGVRAMLLYPMNALANDQLKRLRQLLAEFPDITFGRYTGETEESYAQAIEMHRDLLGEDPLPNEMISREQIVESPPHILITNFAMLEYLLLRPRDSSLFDGGSGRQWRFIVLDEVHVYDGTKGTEIAYLLRRLRDRVARSQRGRLTCVGTSATLGEGDSDLPRLVEFAAELFDEPFTAWSVIRPSRVPIGQGEPTWSITSAQVDALLSALDTAGDDDDVAALVEAASQVGCPVVEPAATASETLGRLLDGEASVQGLRRRLAEGAIEIDQIVWSTVLSEELASGDALVRLVELAWRAVDSDGEPLIPARYHLMLRALEGAFACIAADHPAGEKRLSLARLSECPACADQGRRRKMFEFGACRRCGAGYAIGRRDGKDDSGNELLRSATLVDRSLDHLLLTETSVVDDEDELVEDSAVSSPDSIAELCVACGAISIDQPLGECCSQPARLSAPLLARGTGGVARRCAACGGRTNGDIVFRFLSGIDASSSVVATALYQELPGEVSTPARPLAHDAYAGARKLLTFADSRQDAAFFASFMQRTHDRSIQRRLIWETLDRLNQTNPGVVPRLGELVDRLTTVAIEYGAFPPDASSLGRQDHAKRWLFAETIGVDIGIGLEGTGLARISVVPPDDLVVPDGMVPDGLTPELVLELTLALLGTLRYRNGLVPPEGVDLSNEYFSPRNFVTYVRGTGPDSKVVAWSPAATRNGRLDLVERTFSRHGVASDPRQWLQNVWGWLTAPASPWARVFPSEQAPRFGTVFRLSAEHLGFAVETANTKPFVCSTCRSVTWFDLGGVCAKYGCSGTVGLFTAQDDDHYRFVYTSMEPVPARVEEHTAQLSNAEAASRQMEFVRGAVNVLSCSTTFELGVDVGEIQAVMMRNVPPGPANYVQRAGRAGRRKGSPALVVTMAQRRNHDVHFFDNPMQMIDGRVQPPVIKVDNAPIARRHVHAVALSRYLRHRVESGLGEPKTVEEFFLSPDGAAESVSEEWAQWLKSHPDELRDELQRLLPRAVADEIDVDGWGWAHSLVTPPLDGDGGWLHIAESRVRGVLDDLQASIDEHVEAGKLDRAARVQKVRKAVASTRLLNELARKIIIPKYGFPVDTAPLELTDTGNAGASKLELDRDLSVAIVEYAPESEVIANKALWRSVGVVIPRGLQLPTYLWRVCRHCHSMTSVIAEAGEPTECSVCGSEETAGQGRFIWPEYGFVGKYVRAAGGQRPRRIGSAEPHFVGYGEEQFSEEVVEVNGRDVVVLVSRHGEVQMVNRGSSSGFWLCRTCGRMEQAPSGRRKRTAEWKHEPATGRSKTCINTAPEGVYLGHRYRTDAIELRLDQVGTFEEYQAAGEALMAALPQMGIRRSDIAALTRRYSVHSPPGLVLLDAVPGGAGHTHFLRDHLQEWIDHAVRKVGACSCSASTSCYGCLRAFENQRIQDTLTRAGALAVLSPYASTEVLS